MTVVKINAITVPGEQGAEIARRFAERVGAVDSQGGFEGFELLRPTDGRDVWLVVSRWRDEAAFQAWLSSPSFAEGHRGVTSAGHGGPAGHGSGSPGGGRPVAMKAELWSFDIATAADPK